MSGNAIGRLFATFGLLTLLTATVNAASNALSGRDLAFDGRKGKCLACHVIANGEQPGNIGPPLRDMQQRYPDKQQLRARIHDATINNPNSLMPPYGRHRILSDTEIDQIVDYLYTL